MVKKDLKVRHAVIALVITLIIFLIGGLLGYSLNVEKSKLLTEETHALQAEMENIQIALLYMDTLGPESSCSVLSTEVARATEELNQLGKRLRSYQDADDFGSDFFMLKDQYSFLELRTWLFYHNLRENCDTDILDVVYFYSSEACEGCIGQGKILDNMKEKLGEKLLIFSLDVEWDQPIMKAFMSDFNVESAPAVIINSQKYAYLEETDFNQIACEAYKEKPNFC